ncbi:bifunctional folylpolyglutamate synthase/dihydrofolate synthase [Frigoriflavimonas asaccharolytica]|uniref:Dihydrofolate synthase/folylpolyglutamate synthase n=1 Tax=Frigoriflavimonas asaccharolytica TaxID=2735899 RepID=A0A8J8KA45_9FLAO|nr:folylpolyglutamate synthase/dihydrofolate synthase family protein [Frigoriflavimonas asaccharolytica]NRS91084.1 dihydrofolate synthase/folylpolyglutamate synthase [Frigoriflavimonas asaccharolytica]
MTKERYKKAVEWLFVQNPNYQVQGLKAYKPGLDNITALCKYFGNPQDKIKTIHIGGTNGKGSTCNMLASILQESGLKVGLYTSPHLIDFTERIKINGKNADEDFVYNFISKLKNLPENIRPSFFEFTTIMAFEYFYQNKVDIAIIEVGLGGRLDSTNIINPIISAITNVDLDHQNILGNTLEEISFEKAGIIKNNITVVSGEEKPLVKNIFINKAKEIDAPFLDATIFDIKLSTDLKGNYQKKNLKVVLGLVQQLQILNFAISNENIETGLLNVQNNTNFMGRWQQISENPLIICDTAHNLAGMEIVLSQLKEIDRPKHLLLGFVEDKELDGLLRILPKEYFYYFVKPNVERGRNPEEYEVDLKKYKINYKFFKSATEGYLSVKQSLKKDEMLFFGGSNFIVGEILQNILEM